VFVLLIAVGGILAVEATSAGQFMVSRPLPSAIIAGLLLGSPEVGFLVGAILEAFHLPRLPLGGAIIPEGGPSAVAATALAIQVPGTEGLLASVVLGLGLGELGGYTWALRRRWNAWIIGSSATLGDEARSVVRAQWRCLGLDFLRGCVLTGFGLLVANQVTGWVPSVSPEWGSGLLPILVVAALVPLGALLRTLQRGYSVWLLFGAGLVVGVTLGFGVG